MIINSKFYKSKKFQGIVICFDFDVPQVYLKKTYCVVQFKFLFFGFWITFSEAL